MRGKCVRWSAELAAEVIRRIQAGESLHRVCKDPAMPSPWALRLWARTRPAFGAELQAARGPGRRGGPGGFQRAGPGRAPSYTPELAQQVCDRLADGCSMRQLGLHLDLPSARVLFGWMREHPEFRQMYLDACEARALMLRDEALEIVDDPAVELARARLRADMRMKRAAVCQPRTAKAPPPPPEPAYEDLLAEVMKRYPDPDE